MYKIESKKDVVKLIRSFLELVVIAALVVLIISQLFTFVEYVPYDRNEKSVVSGKDHGFIAVSYFGVDRDSTASRISEEKLNEQLKALYDCGYVTITQDDIEKYYKEGTPLPDKALYLMFEDGRHDTSVYSQKVMEKYNYKATMFSYADKFTINDTYFLMPKDLLKLKDTTFWELGSNGYRLSYINVFDRYDRYLGELESTEFSMMSKYFNRNYNHYLMDYIRDSNDIPMESNSQMKERIAGEYRLMEKEYKQGLGFVPKAYVLLHSNTGQFGENAKVSSANEEALTGLFGMNFNREGYCLNVKDSSIYDLTRLESQANWYTNHLLMRIWDDLPEEDKDYIIFVEGDISQKQSWETIKGKTEYKTENELFALTSMPQDSGIMGFKKEIPENISFSANLLGNKMGSQSVFLRSDSELLSGIEVRLMNNVIYLIDNGVVIDNVDLYDFDQIPKVSVEEDKRDSLVGEYNAFARYAVSHNQSVEYKKLADEAAGVKVRSVEEGAEEYRPSIQINELGNRKLDIALRGNRITVKIDDKIVWEDREMSSGENGGIYLQSAWSEYGYSQRNIADDVYDGVFSRVEIKNLDTDEILYTNKLQGIDKSTRTVKDSVNKLINWFIKNI